MVEARARHGDQSASKTVLTDIQTRTHKRRKMDATKAAPIVYEPQTTSVPPLGNSKPGSPKKIKTLMSDDVSLDNLTITTLMQDSGSTCN